MTRTELGRILQQPERGYLGAEIVRRRWWQRVAWLALLMSAAAFVAAGCLVLRP